MFNFKPALESVKSSFSSKNWKRLAGKFTKYQLALLLFFVVSTGVIYVGSITAPGQISPVQAQQYQLTTEDLHRGGEIRTPVSRALIPLQCVQPYGAQGAGVVVNSTKGGKWLGWIQMNYNDLKDFWVEDGGKYVMRFVDRNGQPINKEVIQGFFTHLP